MTHYRLTLMRRHRMIAERHSFSGAPPGSWHRSLFLGSIAYVRMCWLPDEACDRLMNASSESVQNEEIPPIPPTRGAKS